MRMQPSARCAAQCTVLLICSARPLLLCPSSSWHCMLTCCWRNLPSDGDWGSTFINMRRDALQQAAPLFVWVLGLAQLPQLWLLLDVLS